MGKFGENARSPADLLGCPRTLVAVLMAPNCYSVRVPDFGHVGAHCGGGGEAAECGGTGPTSRCCRLSRGGYCAATRLDLADFGPAPALLRAWTVNR